MFRRWRAWRRLSITARPPPECGRTLTARSVRANVACSPRGAQFRLRTVTAVTGSNRDLRFPLRRPRRELGLVELPPGPPIAGLAVGLARRLDSGRTAGTAVAA